MYHAWSDEPWAKIWSLISSVILNSPYLLLFKANMFTPVNNSLTLFTLKAVACSVKH